MQKRISVSGQFKRTFTASTTHKHVQKINVCEMQKTCNPVEYKAEVLKSYEINLN